MKLTLGLVETVNSLDEGQVMMIHHELHKAFAQWKNDKFVSDGYSWTKDDFFNTHKLVVGRMEVLGLEHGIKDELDQLTLPKKNEREEIRTNEAFITLETVLERIKGFKVKDFISLDGELVNKGKTSGPVEVVIEGLEAQICGMIKWPCRVYTAHMPGSYIPVFHAEFPSRTPQIKTMTDNGDVVKPGVFFKFPEVKESVFGVGILATKTFGENIVVQKLQRGVRVQVHKVDNKVFVWNEQGVNLSHKLPCFVNMLLSRAQKETMLEGVIYSKDSEMKVEGMLKGPEPMILTEDIKLVVQLLDVIWWGESIHNKGFVERLDLLGREFKGLPCCNTDGAIVFGSKESMLSYLGREDGFHLVNKEIGFKKSPDFVGNVLEKVDGGYNVYFERDKSVETDPKDIKSENLAFVGKVNTTLSLNAGERIIINTCGVYKYPEKVRLSEMMIVDKTSEFQWNLKKALEMAESSGILHKMVDFEEEKPQCYEANDKGLLLGDQKIQLLRDTTNDKKSGKLEWGVSNDIFREFWLDEQLFRMTKVEQVDKERFLFGTIELENAKWAVVEIDTPYVLSQEAIKEEFIPKMGMSCLSKEERDRVPLEYQWWKLENRGERLKVRGEYVKKLSTRFKIVEQYGGVNVLLEREGCKYFAKLIHPHVVEGVVNYLEIETLTKIKEELKDFTLSHHWWKESTSHWDLFIGDEMMVLTKEPIGDSKGFVRRPYSKGSINKGIKGPEFLSPMSSENKTSLLAWMERKDEGKVIVLDDTPLCKRFNFLGKVLVGTYEMVREKENVNSWKWSKVVVGKATLTKDEGIVKGRMMLSVSNFGKKADGKFHVIGSAFSYGVWNGEWFSPEVVRDRPERVVGISVCVGPHELEDDDGVVESIKFENDTIVVDTIINTLSKQKEIEDGNYVGFSVEIEVLVDNTRHIIKKIMEYDRVNIVANPACEVCTIADIVQ